jgi:hypothetical protein
MVIIIIIIIIIIITNYRFLSRQDRLWGPPRLLSNGYRGALSLGVKLPGREVDHSLPSRTEVKKT